MPQNFSLSLANSDQEVYSTPNTVSKPKRLLSADSSPDVSMSDPKKIRNEDYSSLTDDSELSHLDALTREDICKKLMAAIDFMKTQHERISKLESNLVDVKLTFVDAMTLRFVDQRAALTSQPAVPVHSGKPLYSQAVRGQQAPVPVASYSSSAMPPDQIFD